MTMSTRADERYVRASRANPAIPERNEPQAVFAERNTSGIREHISSTSFKMRAYTSPSLFCTRGVPATFAAVP